MNEHVIVVDLGFGDAGKGTVVDWLCRTAPRAAVVRFNGGAQAAHNVVTDDGRHHTFAQFGAGTLAGTPTHLAHTVLVDPFALVAEAAHLEGVGVPDPFATLTVDERALLTTPWHRAANQAREIARGADRHGSCGMGVGETARYALDHPGDAPTVGDCRDRRALRRKLALLAERLDPRTPGAEAVRVGATVDDVAEVLGLFASTVRIVDGDHVGRLLDAGPVVFEGAQGVLLDEWAGFHPYTTWSTTTTANALAILAEHGRSARRLGVVRTVTTRHGAGPLPTEDARLTAALPEPHNGTGPWQGAFRVGHFDLPAHRYALAATDGVDGLAVTHLDLLGRPSGLRVATRYLIDGREWTPTPSADRDLDRQERLTRRLGDVEPDLEDAPVGVDEWFDRIGGDLGVPVVVGSSGPTASAKRATVTL